MTEDDIHRIANEVLRETLGAHGFEHADVQAAPNFDGEPSLYVVAHFRPLAGVTNGEASTRALSALRRRLLATGEERFPYIRYDYPDDEVLGDDPSDTGAGQH